MISRNWLVFGSCTEISSISIRGPNEKMAGRFPYCTERMA